MSDLDDAIRRTEAAVRVLDARMQCAVGDLDYESCLHETRTLTTALLALRKRRGNTGPVGTFSQNSASLDNIKDK